MACNAIKLLFVEIKNSIKYRKLFIKSKITFNNLVQ